MSAPFRVERGAPRQRNARFHERLAEATLWSSLEGLARGGRVVLPNAWRSVRDVHVVRDLRYGPHGTRNLLDVYVPAGDGPFPVALYLHGGGFRILSKDTHWMMAREFATRGFVVFVPNYRLVPLHCFPAAVEDACEAYLFALANAARFGGDASRLVVSGESAGGNLSVAVSLASCVEGAAPFARRLFDAAVVPHAVLPMCGIYQISGAHRFAAHGPLSRLVELAIVGVEEGYLARGLCADPWLADPLVFLESEAPTARTLPPVFTSVGTRDPLLDDTRRLEQALRARGVRVEARVYPGELHGFQALWMLPSARDHWRRAFAFLDGTARS